MRTRAVSADRIRITYTENPFSLVEIRNVAAGGRVLSRGAQSFLVRTPLRVSDPAFLTELLSFSSSQDSLRFVIADQRREYKAEVTVSGESNGIRMGMKVDSPVPLWVAEWKVSGLELEEVIIPALGGQALSKSMPPETTLTYKYPFWWNAQFVIGAMKRGGFWIRTQDVGPVFKLLRVRRESGTFTLSLGFESTAPLTATTLEATWYLDCYRGGWKVPADIHRAWLERAFGLCRFGDNPSVPSWVRSINFVLEIWGIGKDRPEPLHTFEDMERVLVRWARLHPPRQTLVYLPGFAEHGIDSRAPDYNPSEQLGGEARFKQLMDRAHALGFRVMVHTNALCMTFDHPRFREMKTFQVVDQFDRPQGWGLDIDGDWLAEPYFAYMNPGERAWGDVLERVVGDLVARFGVDGVFLDQTLLAFNVSKGPNFVTGMRELVGRLQKAFPGLLFAGEGLHEQIVSALAVAQIHGIDSLTEIHGVEGKVPWREAHPVSTYLFGNYTRYVAHLLTRHPSHPLFRKQEAAYAKLAVIPALCLYNRTQGMHLPAVKRMIKRARTLRFAS